MRPLRGGGVGADKPLEDFELEDAGRAGQGLPAGTQFWSKSGDAYDVHPLVARVRLPLSAGEPPAPPAEAAGTDYVLAVFTKGVKTVPGIIPRVHEKVAARYVSGQPGRST